jgi:hypothetical protein
MTVMELVEDEFNAVEREYSSMVDNLQIDIVNRQCKITTLEANWFTVRLSSAGWTVCYRIREL